MGYKLHRNYFNTARFWLFIYSLLPVCYGGYVFQIHSAVLTLHSLSQTLWVSTQQIRSCNNNIVSKTCVKICTFSYLGLFSNVSQARNWSALKIILVKYAVSFTVWDFDVQHFEWQQYIFFFCLVKDTTSIREMSACTFFVGSTLLSIPD